jgi:epoxyqueuosine reductase QueG
VVVAGNSGLKTLVPRLQRFLGHADEHVREHAAWALARLSKHSGDG